MKKQERITVVHVDDSKTPDIDNRISAWCKKNHHVYKRIDTMPDMEDLLRKDNLGSFVLVSDVRLGSYHIITEFFAWLDEEDYKDIRKILDKKMIGLLFYSGDYAHKKKAEMDYRIPPAFLKKFLGGFHPDDVDLIIKALDKFEGTR